MIVVIQDAAARQPHAGHMRTRDGKRVIFVADPGQAPAEPDICHARPDGLSSFGASWRKLVLGYNANPRGNPLGLLPAHQLYPHRIYTHLYEELGPRKTYVLAAGWGLIRASLLTPDYAISLDPGAEPWRRRGPDDGYADFCMLPAQSDEDLYFIGGAAYLPLFCRLTAAWPGRRIVFHPAVRPPEAPGCELRVFDSDDPADRPANWRHACASALLSTRQQARSEPPARKISHIEAHLRAAVTRVPDAASADPAGEFNLDAAAVRAAIHGAHGEIEEYRWLQQALRSADVTDAPEFQARFNAFHRIEQRSKGWHDIYYRLLENAKAESAGFANVLYDLWEDTGRYEPAFASRLVAAADPSQPVWDRFALMNAGLRAPSYLDPNKLEKAVSLYGRLGDWYAARLDSPGGRRILALFDEEAPEFGDLGPLQKLEFVLRRTRAQHRTFSVPARPDASLSRPA